MVSVDLLFISGADIYDTSWNYIGYMAGLGGKLGANYSRSYTDVITRNDY